jgi:adenylate cyclase
MKADASFARPVAMYVCAWASLPTFDLDLAEKQMAHALELDPTDPESHRIMGSIKMMRSDFTASRHHHERALELAPNEAYVVGRCGAFYTYSGEPERALGLLDRAEHLIPSCLYGSSRNGLQRSTCSGVTTKCSQLLAHCLSRPAAR